MEQLSMTNPLGDVFRIDNFNDTFALGHYARVMDVLDRRTGKIGALKLLRPEHLTDEGEITWELRAFASEADLLMKLSDSPAVVGLLDCGYLSGVGEAPVGGEVRSFGLDVMGYGSELRRYTREGWRPYLLLENLPRTKNLLYLMKPNTTATRRRLPTEEGLALALQFAELLHMAHQQNIVYMDHKLEHVYWDGMRLQVIDLNSSRQLESATNDPQSEFRRDIHNLCVGILYPIFTGLSPVQASLRPQPGGLQQVEDRYSEITTLDFGIEPMLSQSLKSLLQRGAAMQIASAEDLIGQLQEVASLHGWDFSNFYTSPTSRDARTQMRAGLTRLRDGQEKLREARDLFREAAIKDNITEDIEAELRRLVKAINDALNNRPIP
jgi:serine/threonine protein kinase